MIVKNPKTSKKLILKLLAEKPPAQGGTLIHLTKNILKKRSAILKLAKKYQTPFYLFDQKEAKKSILEFKQAFKKYLPDIQIYYAMKSNHHPLLVKEVIKHGFNVDVSSGRELELALKLGAKKMVFSGPAKSEAELKLAIKHRNKLIIHLDSFGELKRLGKLLKRGEQINAGVRIITKYHGHWSKFGIPLADLKKFWLESKKYPGIKLHGIQSHMSFNQTALPYQNMIKEISGYLKNNFNYEMLAEIKFFDFGGGYYPSAIEADFPWELEQGRLVKIAAEHFDKMPEFTGKYYVTKSATPDEFAKGISQALKKYFEPVVKCQYFCEPGRIISNNSLHMVNRVVDIKNKTNAIMDGAINMLGVWEKYEDVYCPLVNLTHPDLKEIKFTFYGSLCTPYDIWGYYCYAKKISEGDVIILPFQGAYTYVFANEFIKPVPPTYILK